MLMFKTSLSNDLLPVDCFDGDGGGFTGYAVSFGVQDQQGHIIERGAFEETLKRKAPKMYFEHGWALQGGYKLPIGKYVDVRETDSGLYCEGRLTKGLSFAQEVRAALVDKTITGLSVGGYIEKGDIKKLENGVAVIKRWADLREISVTSDPAQTEAIGIESVKSSEYILDSINEIETVRDLESVLREVAGLSKRAASLIVAKAKTVIAQGDPDAEADKQYKQIIDRINSLSGAR